MPIVDNGDIVRGLGFTTLYAAYMEEAIDECRVALMKRDPAPPKGIEKWPISRRVAYVQERLSQFLPLPQELAGLPGHLDYVSEVLTVVVCRGYASELKSWHMQHRHALLMVH